MKPNQPFWRWLGTGAAVLLAAGLLYLAFRGVAWQEVAAALAGVQAPYLVLSLLLSTGTFLLRGLRWRILLNAGGPVPAADAIAADMVGYMANNLAPGRSGEVIRAVLVGRRSGLSASYALATSLTERILDAIILVLVSLGVLAILPGLPGWLYTAMRTFTIAGLAALSLLLLATRFKNVWLNLAARLPLPDRWQAPLAGMLERFLEGMTAFQKGSRLLGFLLFSIGIWLLDACGAVAAMRAFHHSLTIPQAMLYLASLALSSGIPLTPGSVGVLQYVARNILPLFGIPAEVAVTYSLTVQVVSLGLIVTWGLVGLAWLGARWNEVRSLTLPPSHSPPASLHQ